ncbi:MAG: SDR family NAD(P)-dependent oxidoreductase [Planctomycetaceae bacterium]|nr:SDR family NAD(P)-dependent oxidoreductase [Planctomycetaceae bacterium]
MADAIKRIVLVTGVSRGLGRAMADGFRDAGCTVLGCSRSTAGIAELRDEFGDPHRFAVVDVASEPDVAEWAKRLLREGLVPDLLINNAALINENAPLWEVSSEKMASLLDVNVLGTHHVIRQIVPAMIERGSGVIVNFSSGWGRSTSPDVAPYCATKWAIEGLTRALASELPPGMAAIPLNPGIINTEMLQSCFADGAAHYPTAQQWATRAVPFLLGLGPQHNGQPLTAP